MGPDSDRIYSITGFLIEEAGLSIRLDTDVHGLVEPTGPVPLTAYERDLEATRFGWVTEWPR